MSVAYEEFLNTKRHSTGNFGFEPVYTPSFLFDFQSFATSWAIRKGRGAMFADCGLGKTPMQLVWAENVRRHTNKPVLILTPLAVANQTREEGEKFDIEVHHCRDGKFKKCINVTNYERLHLFSPEYFGGVVCDESSSIKAMDGERRRDVTAFLRKVPHRLLCTATAAPNDYIELGTASEALGDMGQRDMLSQFFRSTDNISHVFNKQGDFWNSHKWIFKPHSERPFWRWVCSWARAFRKPSDLGFEDGRFILPRLDVEQHVIQAHVIPDGEFLPRVAVTLNEQRAERRATMAQRCEKVASLVSHGKPAIVWCHLNQEGDALEEMIPGCVQVSGADSDDAKEEKLMAFSHGQVRVIITKPTIAGFGMNWQHCSHMTFFPSHSFEQYYQGVRRCLRFGQMNPVKVDIVTTPGEAGVTANLTRKAEQAEAMFANLVAEMNNELQLSNRTTFDREMELPSWL
mgnify:FL=1